MSEAATAKSSVNVLTGEVLRSGTTRRLGEDFFYWNVIIRWFWAPSRQKALWDLTLDFDLQDINLIPRRVPGETLGGWGVKMSRQVKSLRGLHLVRSPPVIPV